MNSLSLQLRYEFDMFFSMAGLVLIRIASVSLPVHRALHRKMACALGEAPARNSAVPLAKILRPAIGQNSNVVYWKRGSLTEDELAYLRPRRTSYSNPWQSVAEDTCRKSWSQISLVRLKALESSFEAPAAAEQEQFQGCK